MSDAGEVQGEQPGTAYHRELGNHRGEQSGPLLLVLGGIHGNEPAGVLAAQRVLAALQRERPPMKGVLHCFAGNLRGLAAGTRFLDEDLNRIWSAARLAADADEGGGEASAEMHEREALRLALRAAVADLPPGEEVCFLDLHTSSAAGVPFICVGDTMRNRRFARDFPVPVLLGLEEQIDGALLEFLNNRGMITMGFEGGKHDAPEAVDAHEAAIWAALGSAGMLPRGWPRVAQARRDLDRSRGGLPRILEVRYRHAITPEDGFVMRPGFRNFQQVEPGEVLADDRNGAVRCPLRARVLLPLYQGQGDDGFFLGRPVRRFWLEVSRWMRRLRVDRLAPLLPGVRRHPRQAEALLVNRRVARWAVVQVFHLLGYRKRRSEGEHLAFSRREYDFRRPERIDLD